MKAKDFTYEQCCEFMSHFQDISKVPTSLEGPAPWGCPWNWCEDKELIGESIQEMAENFYKEIENDMKQALIDEQN